MKKIIPGIDGLRTLGVAAVIFYHIAPSVLAGGYLGVLIFFVISGYLVTDSLLREWTQNKKINWKNFAIKRLKRLYPLMLFIFLVAALFFFFFQPHMLTGMRESFVSSVLSVNNWWQISNGSSYFMNFAQTANSAFKHIYFLSIEGQFYLVIALLFLFLPKRNKRARLLSALILSLLAIVSALLMAWLFVPSDPTRVYYGTDTRIFALLIGASLAFLFRRERASTRISYANHVFSFPLAFLAVVTLFVGIFFLPDKSPIAYYGGMFVFSLIIALLILLLAHPSLTVNRFFSSRFFGYIDSRSYGIYLWQLPVLVALENSGVATAAWYNIIWELALIVALSEFSYRMVEKPLKNLHWQDLKDFFTKNVISVQKMPRYALLLLVAAALVIIFSAPTQAKDLVKLQAHIGQAEKNNTSRNAELAKEAAKSSHSATPETSTPAKTIPPVTNVAASSPAVLKKAAGMPVVAVGDSVLLDVSSSLQTNFPLMYINGLVGRQASDGLATLQATPPAVLNNAQAFLVNLGINGTVAPENVSDIMSVAGKRPVYWVNVRVPRSWQAGDNAELAAAAKQYSNLHILDWYDVSNGHPEYFVSDGVHLTNAGVAVYSNLVTNAIAGK